MSKGAYVGVDGIARKIKKGYVGVDTELPIYDIKEKTVSITANNISEYFTVTNGSYYFKGSGSVFTTTNAANPTLATIGYFDSNGWNGRATKDGQGNDIASSYLKKSEISYGTADLTAGSSPLETGKLYFVYE